MSESRRCILCAVYRPDADPRQPNLPPVCDGDRRLLDRHLGDVAEMYGRLVHPDPPDTDDRTYILTVEQKLPGGAEITRYEVEYDADPTAPIGGAGPVRGESRQPRVSGSAEPAAPAPLDALDLTLPARQATRSLFARGALGLDPDQVGTLSVATILDTWVRDWRDTLWPDHSLPTPTVADLTVWLRNRVDDVCNQHPAVDEFAAEIRELRSALRGVLGETEAQPETDRYEGISCRRCDLRGVLMRRPGDTYIECGNCGVLSTEEELADWAARLAGYHRSIRTPEEIAELLRRPVRHATRPPIAA